MYKRCEGPLQEALQTTAQGNKRGHKQCKNISCLLIGRFCIVKMVLLPEVICRFNTIPIKLPLTFFSQLEKNYFKFHMEPQKSLYRQDNPKQKEHSWMHHAAWLQTVPQDYSNQNSMVLVPKLTYKPMKQSRGLRNNATHIQPSNFWQTWQTQAMGKAFPILKKHSQFNKRRWENWLAICKKLKLDHFLTP